MYARVCEGASCRASQEQNMYTNVYIEREKDRNIYVHIDVFICRYVCIYDMHIYGERERERQSE